MLLALAAPFVAAALFVFYTVERDVTVADAISARVMDRKGAQALNERILSSPQRVEFLAWLRRHEQGWKATSSDFAPGDIIVSLSHRQQGITTVHLTDTQLRLKTDRNQYVKTIGTEDAFELLALLGYR